MAFDYVLYNSDVVFWKEKKGSILIRLVLIHYNEKDENVRPIALLCVSRSFSKDFIIESNLKSLNMLQLNKPKFDKVWSAVL